MGDWTKEPWEFDFFNLKATHEIWPSSSHPEAEPIVVLDPRDYERATNCVNAMCGIPDPEKFVEAAKRLRNGFKLAIGLLEMDANKNELIAEFDQALAAKPEEANDVATD